MKKIYRGLLVKMSNSEEEGLLGLVDDKFEVNVPLAEILENDIDKYGCYLSVNYYITDKPVDIDELPLKLMETLYGEGDAEYRMRYSEYTGYLWTDEEINVGGHDLLNELKSNIGKWIHMEIEFSESKR